MPTLDRWVILKNRDWFDLLSFATYLFEHELFGFFLYLEILAFTKEIPPS